MRRVRGARAHDQGACALARWVMRRLGVALPVLLLAAGCASVPRVELTSYTTAYAEVFTVTNSVLDIVAPYERIVIRNMPVEGIPASSLRRGRGAFRDAAALEAYAQAPPPRPTQEEPGIAVPRRTPASPPAQGTPAPPARPTQEEPGIAVPRPTSPPQAAQGTPAPPRPTQEEPGIVVPRPKPASQPAQDAPPAPRTRPALEPVRRGTTFGRVCSRSVTGADPYCYEMRDGYADIGDPPLVGAYRNLANVVLRFNSLLIAYSEGITARLVQQEIAALSSSVTELTKMAPVSGASGGPAFAASFAALVQGLGPITTFVGGYYDRAQLRAFLLRNADIVEQALLLMATNSVELYANVAIGTNFFMRATRSSDEIVSLGKRRREIRRLISNWTVLLDDTRRMLRELRLAIENSDGLETRIHNLEGAVLARIDTSAIKKQIATLGAPTLPP